MSGFLADTRKVVTLATAMVILACIPLVFVLNHDSEDGVATAAHAKSPLGQRTSTSRSAPKPSQKPKTPSAPATIPPNPNGFAPEMLRRIRNAQTGAKKAGYTLTITSGWRSEAKQQELFDEAVAQYGSVEEATKWVLPPGESEHSKGRAADLGPYKAAVWLGKNGAKYGLCRRYRNEWWHFEPLTAPGGRCPALQDSAADGNVQRTRRHR